MHLQHLHLYTSQLQAQYEFYTKTLGLQASALQEATFHLTIGNSQLHFHEQETATPYHFAINIPANKSTEALIWLQARLKILPYKGEAVINFEAWNAEAIYFYDADQNIVELIARKNTQPTETAAFGAEQWLGISEIGTPTSTVPTLCARLQEQSIPHYSGDLQNFAAMGEEDGLFIVINKEERSWMPNNDQAFASPFEIQFQQGTEKHLWRFEEGQFLSL